MSRALCEEHGIDLSDLARRSGIPEDLLARLDDVVETMTVRRWNLKRTAQRVFDRVWSEDRNATLAIASAPKAGSTSLARVLVELYRSRWPSPPPVVMHCPRSLGGYGACKVLSPGEDGPYLFEGDGVLYGLSWYEAKWRLFNATNAHQVWPADHVLFLDTPLDEITEEEGLRVSSLILDQWPHCKQILAPLGVDLFTIETLGAHHEG